jgi:hypothetical protein
MCGFNPQINGEKNSLPSLSPHQKRFNMQKSLKAAQKLQPKLQPRESEQLLWFKLVSNFVMEHQHPPMA